MHRLINTHGRAGVAAALAAVLGCGGRAHTAMQGGAVPADLLVSPSSVGLAPGDSQPLTVSVLNGSGLLIVGVAVGFRSSDTAIATVSATGVVHAEGPVGRSTVTVESAGARRSVPVTVFAQPASATLSPSALHLAPRESASLTATARDAGGAVIVGAPVHFTSSAPSVATVSAAGLVRAADAFGTAIISARLGAVTATASVQVEPRDSLLTRITLPGGAYGIDVSSQGVVYATLLHEHRVARISLVPPTVQRVFETGMLPTGVAFNPGGTRAYVTNQGSRALSVVTVANDALAATVPIDADPFVALVSPDGSTIIVTGNSGNIDFVSDRLLNVEGALQAGRAPNGLAFNATGTRLYVSTSFGGDVREVDPATRTLLRTFVTGGQAQGLAVSADGAELYVANGWGWLGIYSLASGSRLDSIPLAGGGFGLARSPDGELVYVSLPRAGMVQIVARSARGVVKTLKTGGSPQRIAFSADGRRVVVANLAGWVDVVAR